MPLHSLLSDLIRRCRTLPPPNGDGALSDADLLARFTAHRDATAFEVLVWRHGAMVLGVCRRLLRRPCDVEDAFQAAFLTLVGKAGAIRRGVALAGWLYRVAFRIALRLRTTLARQARIEPLIEEPPDRSSATTVSDDERLVLDDEVQRLPEKYRLVVLLCYLQGRTTAEAAQALGWPRGTVLARLAWARRRLAGRLRRRGVAPATGLGVLVAARAAPAAALIATVVESAVHFAAGGTIAPAVAVLVKGVLCAMFLSKLKWAAALLLVAATLSGGLGWWAFGRADAQPTAQARATEPIRPERGDESARPGPDKPKPKPESDKSVKDKSEAEKKERLRDAFVALEEAKQRLVEVEQKVIAQLIQHKTVLADAEERLERLRYEHSQARETDKTERKKLQLELETAPRAARYKLDAPEVKGTQSLVEKGLKELDQREKERLEKIVTARAMLIEAEELLRLFERQSERQRDEKMDLVRLAAANYQLAGGHAPSLGAKPSDTTALESKIDRLQKAVDEIKRELLRKRE